MQASSYHHTTLHGDRLERLATFEARYGPAHPSPTAAMGRPPIPRELHIPSTASYALLVALEAHLAGLRIDLAGSLNPDREIHLFRVDEYLSALRAELYRRWATRAQREGDR